MKRKLKYVFLFLIVVFLFSLIVVYDFFLKPILLVEEVVVVNTKLESNTVVDKNNLEIMKVNKEFLPDQVIYASELNSIIGKVTLIELNKNQIITRNLLDLEEQEPGDNEIILSFNTKDIYSINGTLRNHDVISIYLIKESKNEEELSDSYLFAENIQVVHVRSGDNNDVKDSTEGNFNNRTTSTAKVDYPEVKINKQLGDTLVKEIANGYKLWIVRTN